MTLRRRAVSESSSVSDASPATSLTEELPELPPGWERERPKRRVTKAESGERATAVIESMAAGMAAAFAEVRVTPLVSSPIANLPALSAGMNGITVRVFDLPDPEGEYAELEGALSVGSRESDDIAKALDVAEDSARRAHRLYVNARLDAERFAADAEVIEGALRGQAAAELQAEKESGARTKQITDADVRGKAALLFPDEWRALSEGKAKAELMVKHLERFADLWMRRCHSLAALLARR